MFTDTEDKRQTVEVIFKKKEKRNDVVATFGGSAIGEQAAEGLSGWGLLLSPSLPAKPAAAPDS